MAACGVDTTQITKSSRGAYNAAVKDLKAIDATPAQITRRAHHYRQQWPTATLTPTVSVETPEPTATKDYRWWNCWAGNWVDYPRARWSNECPRD